MTSHYLKTIKPILSQLDRSELLQLEQMVHLQVMLKREDGRTQVQFYTVLQNLFTRDGIKLPPWYVVNSRDGALKKEVEFSMEAVQLIVETLKLSKQHTPHVLAFLYDLCRTHMLNRNWKITPKLMCVQLQQSKALLDKQFPEYPPAVLRKIIMGAKTAEIIESVKGG